MPFCHITAKNLCYHFLGNFSLDSFGQDAKYRKATYQDILACLQESCNANVCSLNVNAFCRKFYQIFFQRFSWDEIVSEYLNFRIF